MFAFKPLVISCSINLENAFPLKDEVARSKTDNIIDFTLDGKNTTTNKDIYYEIPEDGYESTRVSSGKILNSIAKFLTNLAMSVAKFGCK